MNLIKSPLGRLRIVAFLEGLSFIILIGIAVPLKYVYGFEHATQEVGMLHGILFLTYTVLLLPVKEDYNWNWSKTSVAFVASLLPLGTFVAEYRWFRKIV